MSDNQVVAIDIRNVFKRYGDFTALERISMSIYDNEFFTLLGPSGCGKTTLLRMIAGFEGVTQGEITLFGSEIENLPPNKRPVNTVFQNYALFPHMSVIDNVGFGLEMRGSPKQQARQRAGQMLELVQLSSFSHRMPAQLSGGQQQRVALARALAPQPKVLLLDEPLSALDLKLRQAMRFELKEIQRETGITFIFVTHDQQEALTMSDRIAVMSAGRLQQLGDARNIYERPRNRFVADFIGDSNLLEVTVDRIEGGWALCHLGDGRTLSCESVEGLVAGSKAFMSVRPERLSLSGEPVEGASLKGLIRSNIFGGTEILTIVELDVGPQVTVRTANSDRDKEQILEPGTRIYVNMEGGAGRLLAD